MNNLNWILQSPNNNIVGEISHTLNISLACAKILANRGIKSVDEAKIFLFPEIENLNNPFLLPDMDKAVSRIRTAIDKKEKILVYGDSDVDGVTSVYILYTTIKSLGGDVYWYIPKDEGYGLKKEIIEEYAKENTGLIITVDCGISSFDEISYAKNLKVDTIVCDHHEVHPSGIPNAYAVIDPKRADSKYPFPGLAGCSVSFKLSEAVMYSFGKYYNKDLIFIDADHEKISLIKSRNHTITERLIEKIGLPLFRNEAFKKALGFIGSGLIVACDADKEKELIKNIFGVMFENEFVELKELEEKYLNSRSGSLDSISESLKIVLKGNDEFNKPRLKYEIFLRLDRLDDLRMKYFRENYLDVMALGTIADLVPLIDENRTIVKHGLRNILHSKKKGIQALIEKCARKTEEHISAKSVSWDITPVLNAAGRMGKAYLSLELLLADSDQKAKKLLDEILKLNSERKNLQAENSERLMESLLNQCNPDEDAILIVKEENLGQGILGLIASLIVQKYGKPAVVILVNKEESVGSCRSIPGFDIVSALGKLSDILIRYGGHSQAAGFSVKTEKIDEFTSGFRKVVKESLEKNVLPQLAIDSELEPENISFNFLDELSCLEPFGAGNPHPVFSISDMNISEHSKVGSNGNHLKLKMGNKKMSQIDAIGWNLGHLTQELNKFGIIDIAFNLEINNWQDKKKLQMKILDIKPSVTV
ncbi:MAG: single-stranded-DNA-specific exonuclease RecJ [Elusimicrobia bacterium]|nr:single-stranded-DNA-specific exonuclease RecJ [Elusimicrobiota bacterium]